MYPAMKTKGRDTCEWEEDMDSVWETECGKMFQFIAATPAENEFEFCPFCGKVILENEYNSDGT